MESKAVGARQSFVHRKAEVVGNLPRRVYWEAADWLRRLACSEAAGQRLIASVG